MKRPFWFKNFIYVIEREADEQTTLHAGEPVCYPKYFWHGATSRTMEEQWVYCLSAIDVV